MSTKVLEGASLKATTTAVGQHVLEFYALAFSAMPDKQGDRISPKALDEWLTKFYAAGKPLPISFTHAAVKETSDPFNIIGWAPADVDHVWKDSYGLRVRAYLETEINEKAEQVYRLTKRGIVSGASVAYIAEREKAQPDGSTLITKMSVLEAGPCLDPANPDAKVLSVKSDDPVEVKAVDETAWDGGRAMRECSTAAQYRSICAGERTVGDPDERQHWALPHHYLGSGPNANGVRNAMSRLPQTQNLANREAAQRHLEAHMREINPEREDEGEETASAKDADVMVSLTFGELQRLEQKAGRKVSAARLATLKQARDLLDEMIAEVDDVNPDEPGAKANEEEPTANSEEPNAWLHEALAVYETAAQPPATEAGATTEVM